MNKLSIIFNIGIFQMLIVLFSNLNSISGKPAEQIRISAQKCDEYKEIYREYFSSPLPPPFDEPTLGNLRCPRFQEPFIVGGRDSYLDEFPHMASLQYKLNDESFHHGCGGTLISEQYVLTAAHCINAEITSGQRKSPEKVIIGDISLVGRKGRSRRKEISITSIIVHPKWKPEESSYHDIALVKLKGTLKFDRVSRPAVRPACLAQPGQNLGLANNKVTATGWGKISDNSDVQNLLQAVNITVEDSNDCGEAYSEAVIDFRSRFPDGIVSDLFCAGDKGKDTCQGDSGGPLTMTPLANLPCMNYVVGITSVGPSSCGQGTSGIYTRVEKYIDWIEDNVWKNA